MDPMCVRRQERAPFFALRVRIRCLSIRKQSVAAAAAVHTLHTACARMGPPTALALVTTVEKRYDDGHTSWSCELCRERFDDADQLHFHRSEAHGEAVCGKYYAYADVTAKYVSLYYNRHYLVANEQKEGGVQVRIYFYVSTRLLLDCSPRRVRALEHSS